MMAERLFAVMQPSLIAGKRRLARSKDNLLGFMFNKWYNNKGFYVC